MSNILVTGGAGFIGSNFVYYHVQNYPQDHVVVYDALTYAGNQANLTPVLEAQDIKVSLVVGDVCDEQKLYQTLVNYKIDKVVHFAAESHVDRSIDGPDEFIRTNINGTYQLLKSLARYQNEQHIKVKLHHVSTDEVYGALKVGDAAFTENSPYRPNSPYSASKAASDCLVRSFVTTFDLHATTSHCSNNYGPFQFPEKLIPKTIINFLQGKTIGIYGSGQQIRDWIYVDDHCQGIEQCLEKGQSGECYNLGADREVTNIDLVQLIGRLIHELMLAHPQYAQQYPKCRLASEPISLNEHFIEHIADRKGHDFRYAIDSSKAQAHLGFTASTHSIVEFEEAMRQTVAWYLKNESWWQKLLSRC